MSWRVLARPKSVGKIIWGEIGEATLPPLLVAKGVLSHTLTFECVRQCSWKVLNCRRDAAVVQSTGGNRQRRCHYVRVW